MVWTTTGAPPPTMTSPTRTAWVRCRLRSVSATMSASGPMRPRRPRYGPLRRRPQASVRAAEPARQHVRVHGQVAGYFARGTQRADVLPVEQDLDVAGIARGQADVLLVRQTHPIARGQCPGANSLLIGATQPDPAVRAGYQHEPALPCSQVGHRGRLPVGRLQDRGGCGLGGERAGDIGTLGARIER